MLETYGELSAAAYSGGEPGRAVLLADEKVSEMIVDLKKEAGATAKRAVIGIPVRYSFITVVEMPELTDEQLKEAVQFEARRYIPIPLQDVVLDWWPIPKKNDKRGATVLLAAVQRDIVEKYKRIVTVAFPPTRLLGSRGRGAVMTIDIGALSTKISIVVDGIIHAVHHVDRASQAFSLAISQSLGIDFQRAEVMKQSVGISQRPEAAGVRHTITPLIDSLFDEADRLRTSFRRRFDTPVDKAIVLGGGSLMPGFVDYAVERLGIEVILSNPFQKLSYPAFLQPALKKIAPSFTVATGLALRALGEEL